VLIVSDQVEVWVPGKEIVKIEIEKWLPNRNDLVVGFGYSEGK